MTDKGAVILGCFIVVAVLVFKLMPSSPGTVTVQSPANNAAEGGDIGRYQLAHDGDHILVLDTKTAQLWESMFAANSPPKLPEWQRDPVPWSGAVAAPH
jgi:hypothetical protein